MKKFTQEDFDNFEVIDGIKICPSGDYTAIKSFGECCRFGEGCSFGEWCSFGDYCHFNNGCKIESNLKLLDFVKFDRFGSEKRTTYFFKVTEGIYVRCGCFAGWVDEFVEKVKETHGDSKYAKEYLVVVDVAKFRLLGDENEK